MSNLFEQFLMEKHSEQYIGTKDTMIDDFEKWLSEQDIDSFLIFGEMYGWQKFNEGLKKAENIFTQAQSKKRGE